MIIKLARARGKEYCTVTVSTADGYFSVTGELYLQHGNWSGAAQHRNNREPDTSGAVHAEILQFFPELAPLVKLHLADVNGVPIHAVANGWYFYSGSARKWETRNNRTAEYANAGTDRERAARALNISPDALPYGIETREQFEQFASTLRAGWHAAALDAGALMRELAARADSTVTA